MIVNNNKKSNFDKLAICSLFYTRHIYLPIEVPLYLLSARERDSSFTANKSKSQVKILPQRNFSC